jgi:hypothetical protein
MARKRSFYALVEQFWFVREPAARYYWGHGNDFRFPRVKLKPD